ncbi:MAG: ATP-binding protein [Chloroflexota bacterium]|nr:ATP-binding protein [Chloroflexota bacterium]
MTQLIARNPYSATTPVGDPSMFFGREQELVEIIEKRIKQSPPISTILIGGRKIGKTSLLHQIRDRLLEQPNCGADTVIPAYVTFQGISSLDVPTVFWEISSSITHSLREYWGLPVNLSEDLVGDPYKSFRQQMRMMLNRCDEHVGSARFVVLVDEADRLLEHSWRKDVVSNLRDLINASYLKSFVALVITGFRELHDYAITEEEGIGSALGNAAYWTSLNVLTEKECRDLVTVPLSGGTKEEVVRAVYEQSGGHPFIAQYLMQQAWKPNPADIMLADVTKACEEFCNQVKVFKSWEEKFTDLDRRVYQVLAQSRNPLASSDIQGLIEREATRGDVEDSLDFLSYTGVASSRQNKKHVIAGQLYRDWFLPRVRIEKESKKRPKQLQQGQGLDVKRLLVSALVVLLIFAATVAVLVWAAQQVPAIALAFILVIAVVFNLVSIVTVLVMNGIIRQRWAMNFYEAVLSRVPMLALSLYPQAKTDLEEDEKSENTEAEDD